MLIKHNTVNPLKGFQVMREDIKYLGKDLQRPECILAEKDGTIWTADARGGVMKLNMDGSQHLVTPTVQPVTETDFAMRYVQAQGSLPNGLCFDKAGNFIIANWGTDNIDRMNRDGYRQSVLPLMVYRWVKQIFLCGIVKEEYGLQ